MELKKKRVLIVEDEMIIAEDIRDSLESHGYNVIDIISSGEETLARIGNLKPDLVLMDIMLSDEMNGIQTAEKINKKYNIPIIFVTALRNRSELKSHFNNKFSYVTKPYKEAELFTAIEINFYKKEMEAALTNQKMKLINLIDNIPLGVVHLTENGMIVKCNDIALKILDRPIEDLENEYFSYPFEPGETTEIVLQVNHNTNKIMKCTTLKSFKDDFDGYLVFLEDISDLHHHINESKKIKKKFYNVLKNLEIPYLKLHLKDKLVIEDANSAFVKLIGLQSFRKLFHIEIESLFHNNLDLKDILKKIDQDHNIEQMKIEIKTLDEEVIPVKLFAEYCKTDDFTLIEIYLNPNR